MLPGLRPVPLLLLCGAYLAVIVVGSLYPFSGWLDASGWQLHFLLEPLPRYITRHDLTTNLLVYLPFGYLLHLLLSRPRRRGGAIVLATLIAALLSTLLESLQQLLPGRIASNLDVYINTLGGLIGALLALHHGRWLRAGLAFRAWRQRWFQPHGPATPGLWLLLLWLLSQFALLPMPGIGWLDLHLRPIDTPPGSLTDLNQAWFVAVFLEMAAVGAFAACLMRPGRYVSGMTLLFVAGFLAKLFAATVLLRLKLIGGILSLETLAGFFVALWFLLLPVVSRHRDRVAAVLIFALIGLRLYFADTLAPHGSLLNIVGLAAHTASLWPWLALVELAWLWRNRTRH